MKVQIKNLAIISAVLLSTTAFSATAMLETGGYQHAIQTINLMDQDGDQRVSNEEYTQFYEKQFEILDEDRNGVLSNNEWTRHHASPRLDLGTGGYAKQAGNSGHEDVNKKAFLEYHRSFIEATNQQRAEKQDPQKWLERRVGG